MTGLVGLSRKLRHFASGGWYAWIIETDGATAIEYGLILAGVALFILVTVFAMGDALDNLFTAVQTKFANAYS